MALRAGPPRPPPSVSIVLAAVLCPCARTALAAPPAGLQPPALVTRTTIAYPAGAPTPDRPVTVRVRIRIGPDGHVAAVTRIGPARPPFDAAVIAGVKTFGFRPARYEGRAVAVIVPYAHTFLPPARTAPRSAALGPPLRCELRGRLREKGTRLPVERATVALRSGGRTLTTLSDRRGRFRLDVPCGRARVSVHGRGYLAFVQVERLAADQLLRVGYLVERERYDPYELVVYGEQRRTEIARVTLRGREMTRVPGTFGDPFRAIGTLPGVASVIGLLPFPVVRGASPGSTGFLVDRVPVPLLYHLLAGPSVIHPDFLDRVDFYPGGFPVPYGGYTAGVIDGRTRRAGRDDKLLDFDLNLLESGLLVRRPIPGTSVTATAAGRFGYPALLLSLATDEASLSYWDYQLRLDGGSSRDGFTVFAFGAADEVMGRPDGADPADPKVELQTQLRMSFHRLDARYFRRRGRIEGSYRLVLGLDDTVVGAGNGVRTLLGGPLLTWRYRRSERLHLRLGLEGSARDTSDRSTSGPGTARLDLGAFRDDLSRAYLGSAWLEAIWRPSPDWMIRPGARVDLRCDGRTCRPSADPRLLVRRSLGATGLPAESTATARDDDRLWIKSAVGLYHQPPRFFLPVPGLDQMPLRYGLLSAIQTMIGLEAPLPDRFSVDTSLFFNYMDPVIFDLEVNRSISDLTLSAPDRLPGQRPPAPADNRDLSSALQELFRGQRGRACGLELLVRRRSRTGPYGWLSYTLSLSERLKEGTWRPFDFDRTHLLNLVAGLPLRRNWEIGARLQYQSGKPATTTAGYNTARVNGFVRIDLRIDKRAVWNRWMLDFYVDITNVTLFPEEVAAGSLIRYVLPTVGFRARL